MLQVNVHLLWLIQNLMTALVEATWARMGSLEVNGFYRFSFKAQQFDNYKSLLIITKIINLIKRSKFVRG